MQRERPKPLFSPTGTIQAIRSSAISLVCKIPSEFRSTGGMNSVGDVLSIEQSPLVSTLVSMTPFPFRSIPPSERIFIILAGLPSKCLFATKTLPSTSTAVRDGAGPE